MRPLAPSQPPPVGEEIVTLIAFVSLLPVHEQAPCQLVNSLTVQVQNLIFTPCVII
jgi:hypothetical protein